eukprot:8874072-Pyramimonas_sp.AAC.1
MVGEVGTSEDLWKTVHPSDRAQLRETPPRPRDKGSINPRQCPGSSVEVREIIAVKLYELCEDVVPRAIRGPPRVLRRGCDGELLGGVRRGQLLGGVRRGEV